MSVFGVMPQPMGQRSHLQRLANHLFASCARLALGILATHLKEQPGRVFDHFAALLGEGWALCRDEGGGAGDSGGDVC